MYAEAAVPGGVLWRSRGSAGGVIAADGCADVILRGDQVLVAGPSTRPITTFADDDDGALGFRFRPGGAAGTLRLDLAAVRDQLVPLVDLLRRDEATAVREQLLRARAAWPATAPLLAVAGPPRWSAQAHQHASVGTPLGKVIADLGWSERTFRRQMQATFGYGYATLVRLERARRAQALLRTGTPLADAAARAGYADQPHLSREFRRVVGVSPRQFAGSAAKRSTELPSGSSSVA